MISEFLVRIFIIDESIVIDNRTKKRGFYDSVIVLNGQGKRLKENLDITIKKHHLTHKDIRFITDSFGFRGNGIYLQKPNNYYEILFIGDSVTLENYMAEEDTFIGLLQEAYSHGNRGKNIAIINGGIWDVGIQEEYWILKEKGVLIKPNIVILNFYLNDSRPSWGFEREGKLRFFKYLEKSRLILYLYKRLSIQSFLANNKFTGDKFRFGWIEKSKNPEYIKDRSAFSDLINSANLDWGSAWEESSWVTVKDYIEKIKELSVSNNFRLAVICFPVSFQVKTLFNEDYPQRELRAICANLNIPFLDLLPYMRAEKNQELFFDHCHLNFNGNILVSEKIKLFLDGLLADINTN